VRRQSNEGQATTPKTETIALDLTCAECGRSPRRGEVWRVLFADIGEVYVFCPVCAEREFGQRVGEDA
jgi:ribosomal protein L44E